MGSGKRPKVFISEKDLEALQWARTNLERFATEKLFARFAKIVERAEAAKGVAIQEDVPGLSVAHFEAALKAGGGSKVAMMGRLTPAEYIRMTRELKERGITETEAAQVGVWLLRQPWLRDPVTAQTVLRKWGDWAGKAKAALVKKRAAPAPLEDF